MSQVINSNIMSLNAQRNLATSGSQLAQSLQRLSSGMRINSAKDDAAGLAISTRFTAQIRGVATATRNAQDAVSLTQTAEGALGSVTNNLQRMRELAVQASNGTNTDADLEALDTEYQALLEEIGRVASQTQFAGQVLLNGGFENVTFQIGANVGESIEIAELADVTEEGLELDGTTLTSFDDAQDAIEALDAAIDTVNAARASVGATQNRFESVISNLMITSENLTASRSRIVDADFAEETARLTRAQVLQQAGVAMLSQANAVPQNVLSLLR
ncbi:MAG: flagellin [Gammaproteobacteria bacterium]